jgi:hypothetical protein
VGRRRERHEIGAQCATGRDDLVGRRIGAQEVRVEAAQQQSVVKHPQSQVVLLSARAGEKDRASVRGYCASRLDDVERERLDHGPHDARGEMLLPDGDLLALSRRARVDQQRRQHLRVHLVDVDLSSVDRIDGYAYSARPVVGREHRDELVTQWRDSLCTRSVLLSSVSAQ